MDNAGGAQVPDSALDEMRRYFHDRNVYHAGAYRRAEQTRDAFTAIRRRIAGFLGASSPGEVIFGLNATTLLSMFAAALRVTLEPGDEIVVTCLEHEANVTPWLRLESTGAVLRFWIPRAPEATLEVEDLETLLSDRTRLIAVTGASNILGTVTDIPSVATLARAREAIFLVDGVHYAAHRRVNVRRDSMDAFFCSGYKFFGAHIGFAACAEWVLDRLPSLNHSFVGSGFKLELGMQNFEGLAATEGVLRYLSDLAGELGIKGRDAYEELFDAIVAYERMLSGRLLDGLLNIGGVHVYGITDPGRFDMRTPTVAFTVDGHTPGHVARRLGERGFGVNHGHMYAPRVIEWLGLTDSGGVIRASLCHYNSLDEISRFLMALAKITEGQ
jgi:cysteine desulfurase family protein (TIGR01976 family)